MKLETERDKIDDLLYQYWTALPNPKKNYGGRGIKICNQWLDFVNFKDDMYDNYLKHKEKHKTTTIERIDNDKGYFPGNCKWATRAEQSRNTKHSRRINYKGKTKCLVDWANILGVQRQTLANRLDHYPPEIAFNI